MLVRMVICLHFSAEEHSATKIRRLKTSAGNLAHTDIVDVVIVEDWSDFAESCHHFVDALCHGWYPQTKSTRSDLLLNGIGVVMCRRMK
jgi:hypothetical protein